MSNVLITMPGMDARFTFKQLCDKHTFAVIAERSGFKEDYLRQIYYGVRGVGGPGRKVMRRLREKFSEFSADLDIDAELAEKPAA